MTRRTHVYSPSTRTRAKTLRRQGYTYTEICNRLGRVPKGTLSSWLNGIALNGPQRARIDAKILASASQGRALARVAWDAKLKRWRRNIERRAKPLGPLPYGNPAIGKIVLGIMYVCEGGKYPSTRHLVFGNTNPSILKAFLALLRSNYTLDERKWRVRVMHRWDQDGNALIRYWSRVTRIPAQQFYRSYADKRTSGSPTRRQSYHGVCCVQYGDTSLQYELQAIGEAVLRGRKNGGADGDRTRGLLDAIQTLSQLSYCPTSPPTSTAVK